MLSQNTIMKLAKQHEISMQRVCEVADMCEKYGVSPTGNVYKRKPEDIEKIVLLCKARHINPQDNRLVFSKPPEEVEKIMNLCDEFNIPIEAHLFRCNYEDLRHSAIFVKMFFGQKYLTPSIITRKVETLRESMPLVKKLGLLPYTKYDASIFDLSKEEIMERTGVLLYLSIPLHKINRELREDRVNRVYTLSKESFENYCDENRLSNGIREMQRQRVENIVKQYEASKKSVK